MTRLEMRNMLRGWLQDKIPPGGSDSDRQWTNAALNLFLNLGLRDAQGVILAVDPEAFKCTYVADITPPSAGQDSLVEWPAGTRAVIEVALSSDGTYYAPINRVSLKNARDARIESANGFIHYSKTHFMLASPPTTAVTNGIRVIVAPTLTMATDTDNCPIRVEHETLVMKCAQKLALMDVGDPTDKIEAEISAMEQRVPRYYLTAHEPSYLEPTGYDDYEIS